jgi:hypothetical protein
VEQITDNQWEDGTPAWVPAPKATSRSSSAQRMDRDR